MIVGKNRYGENVRVDTAFSLGTIEGQRRAFDAYALFNLRALEELREKGESDYLNKCQTKIRLLKDAMDLQGVYLYFAYEVNVYDSISLLSYASRLLSS